MYREELQRREAQMLSPAATLSRQTQGREQPIAPCRFRTDFQRDCDRIIYSKGFRRLKYKTQVFLPSHGDHYRTRLTHTLEVARIARTVARGLALNEDLTEAIALGHDLGHTPFGHSGERALNDLLAPIHGFRHNEQSLRQVERIENEGQGLNLTAEVRDGILCHTGAQLPSTPEGQIVRFCDRVAYVNHDIDDALRGGLIQEEDLPAQACAILGRSHGERINTLVAALIEDNNNQRTITMRPPLAAALDELRNYLFTHVYRHPSALAEEARSHDVIAQLFHYYLAHQAELPAYLTDSDPRIRVKDYIAGMTDTFALQTAARINANS